MDLRQLRYFVAVAEELHFSRAAARLHISQPPLSQQIRRLEKDLDVRLFHRTNRVVKLTEAGAVLLREAQSHLLALDRTRLLVQRAGRGETARLGVGFAFSAAYTILPAVIQAFRERYPEVELSLQEMQTANQLEALFLDEIQIGILRRPVSDTAVATETLHTEPLVVALPASHSLARRPELSLRDLAHCPFIMARQNQVGFFYWTKKLCREAGFEPRVSREVIDMRNVVELVSVGVGVALVPAFLKRSPVTSVVYKKLRERPRTELALAWRENRLTSEVKAFLAVARQIKSQRSRSKR